MSYLDLPKNIPIDLRRHNKVIIQLESLPRLSRETLPDLVILDEVESIIEQFSSSTMKSFHDCVTTFSDLIKGAKNVLAMDANLGERTMKCINHMRPNAYYIYNCFANNTNDKIYLTERKISLLNKIEELAIAGKNLVIPTNCKKFADVVNVLLCEKLQNPRILLITADMTDEEKAIVFADVNTEWSKYQVIIFTPTCSAGVSFTRKHFDYVCGYFINSTNTVESQRQSMYRARDISSGEYYICLDTVKKYHHYNTVDEIIEAIRYNEYLDKNNIIVNSLCPKWKDNVRKWKFNLKHEIFMQNAFITNQSRCRHIELFVNQCRSTGANIHLLDINQDKTVLQRFKEARILLNLQECQRISDAMDIDWHQYQELIDKHQLNHDEISVVRKFFLKKQYNWNQPITLDFIKKYYDRDTQDIYRRICEAIVFKDSNATLNYIRTWFPHEYKMHKISFDLLKMCGFNDIYDKKEITRSDLMTNWINNKKNLEEMMTNICNIFNDKPPLRNWTDFKTMQSFFNGIFAKMYGMKLVTKGRLVGEKNKIIIKHDYWNDKIFGTTKSNSLPYIIPYHKEPIIDPNDPILDI